MNPPLFPWCGRLAKRLLLPQPKHVTEEWLKENRWWWHHVTTAIDEHFTGKDEPLKASAKARWRDSELSAFLHELRRRCEPAPRPAPWPLLSKTELYTLLFHWQDWHVTASLNYPAILRPLQPDMEFPVEPFAVIHDPRTGEFLWNKNEPAWTQCVVLAANLAVSDTAILDRVTDRVKEWLRDERARTGIKSPKGGSGQRLGKNLWRYCEVLDRKKHGLPMEHFHTDASKARKLWCEVKQYGLPGMKLKNPPPTSPIEHFLRIALREIPKFGKIRPHVRAALLPSVPPLP